MKFIIERTSQWGCETPPIEGATRELVTRYDYRTAGVKENKSAWENFNRWNTDLEPLPNGEWRGKRKDKEKVWVIEIDDIMEFVKKLDEQIILTAPGKFVEDYPCIEIYDDYRE